jgi:hypoxanthine phosphoribosyltransferase
LSRTPIFDESAIAGQVSRLAREIAQHRPRVELVVPILTGAFVFAADLLRALMHEGLDLPVEFISLTRYGQKRQGADITVRMGASDAARGKHVLLVDGVLDHGHTLVKAHALLLDAGATSVAIAVAVDKMRDNALLKADYAAFEGADAFIVGYGMDDAGLGRGLPYIGKVG